MSARTSLWPPLDSGFVSGLRLPSIGQERRTSNDDHSDGRQDRRAAPAPHRGSREAHQLRRVGPVLGRAATLHRYSFGNVLLMVVQCPDATRVAGFRRWLELGRHVQRGPNRIAILTPVVNRMKVEDEETGEKRTIVSPPRGFRVVHVFDISQTDGDELPEVPATVLKAKGQPTTS